MIAPARRLENQIEQTTEGRGQGGDHLCVSLTAHVKTLATAVACGRAGVSIAFSIRPSISDKKVNDTEAIPRGIGLSRRLRQGRQGKTEAVVNFTCVRHLLVHEGEAEGETRKICKKTAVLRLW